MTAKQCFVAFLVLLSLFSLCQTAEEVPDDFDCSSLSGVTIKTVQERDNYLNKTDMTVFALYYREESKTSKSIGYLIYTILHKLEYLAEVIALDCAEDAFPQCTTKTPAEFVFFEVYEPPLYRVNPYTKARATHTAKRFTGDRASETILFNFITASINSRAQKLSAENIENFLSSPNMNKVILFTDKAKTSLLFRGLSNYMYERLLFGEVNKSQSDLISRFKVTKYPTLMIYQTQEDSLLLDDAVIDIYKGKENAKDIAEFLSKYALKEKLYLKQASSSTSAADEVFFKKITQETFESFLVNNPKKAIIVYLTKEVENGKMNYKELKSDIKEFYAQAQGFFLFTFIDCSGVNEGFCVERFLTDEFPSLILLKAVEEGYSNAKERLAKGITFLSMDYSDLKSEIERDYPSNVREANQNIFSSLIGESQYNNKVALFYLFDSHIDLGLTLISRDAKMQKIFDWYVYENPPQSFMANVKNTKLPALTIALPDKKNSGQVQLLLYNGVITYAAVKLFLEQSFKVETPESGSSKASSSSGDSQPKQEKPDFIQTTQDLVKLCSKKKLCMIAFMDMRENDLAKKLFEEKMKEYQLSVAENNKRPVSFGYVNATCQSEFASKFGVDVASLPTLILYSHSKEVYANLIGQFSTEDIKKFISRVIDGGVNFQRTQKENAKLKELKCEEILEVIEKDEDEDFVKEILEEEKKKREAFEAERKKMAGEGKKKKKKTKKKKKKKKKKAAKKKSDL